MVEESIASNELTTLQSELDVCLTKMHEGAYATFGSRGRNSSSSFHDKQAGSTLADTAFSFDSLYRRVPDGYHLQVGLTPLRWMVVRSDEKLELLTQKIDSKSGTTYALNVGHHTDIGMLEPGRTVLNMTPVGTNDPERPRSRFDLLLITNDLREDAGPTIYPEEITSFKIVKDEPSNPS